MGVTDRLLRPVGWASLIANVMLVVTGGAVRLTGSGLGCPTWPRCTEDSYTPHGAMTIHAAIEFGNRMLTFVLVAVAISTFVVVLRSSRRDLLKLSIVMALGIPAQGVIGGITVLTNLNPWVVSLHLLMSMAIIALATWFLFRIDHPKPPLVSTITPAVWLARAVAAVTAIVLYIGTIVTGAGPHAGDEDAPRNGLDPLQMSQLHADFVFLLLGLTLALVVTLRLTAPDSPATKMALTVFVVELLQGAVGFVQYFTNLPEILVGLHMLGAAVLVAVVTRLVLAVRR